MKLPAALTLVLVWILSLAGAFYFGKESATADGGSSRGASPTAASVSAPAAGGKKEEVATAGGSAEVSAGSRRSAYVERGDLSVAQIIDKAAGLMKGGTYNPNSMLKVYSLLDQLEDGEIEEALGKIDGMAAMQQKQMMQMLIMARWAETDGAKAAEYAVTNIKGPMKNGALQGVISGWANSDADAAYEWAQKYAESDTSMGGGKFYLHGLFGAMATKDPQGAWEKFQKLEEPMERNMALSGMMMNIGSSEERQDWLERVSALEDESERTQAQNQLFTHWAMTDPDGAREHVESLPPGKERKTYAQGVAGAMFQTDPKGAADWLVSNSQSDQDRKESINQSISMWAYQDPNAAGEWLTAQGDTEETHQARSTFANTIAQRDPEAAIGWAQSITDPSMRESTEVSVYSQWLRKDKEAAATSLLESGLSEEQKNNLLNQVGPEAQGGVVPLPVRF